MDEVITCFMLRGKCVIITMRGEMWEVGINSLGQPEIRRLGRLDLRR